VGELRLEASSQQEADRPVAGTVVPRPTRPDSSCQQRSRRLELVVCVPHAERLLDQVILDPDLLEPRPDPLRTPPIQRPPILGVAVGVGRVVDVAALPQLVERCVDRRLVDPLAVESSPQLGLGLLASTELAKADRQRVVESRRPAQAARSWPLRPLTARPLAAGAPCGLAVASAAGSIVVTRSFDRPSAA
jgi:hypothetical protein